MPITLSQLAEYRKVVTVEYADEQVKIWFKPGVVTPELTDKLTAKRPDGDTESNTKGLTDFLLLSLDSWDVLGEDGKPLAPSLDLIGKMPIEFLNAIFNAIMRSMQAGEATGATSGAGSFSR